MKLFLKAWLITFLTTWLAFIVLRYESDFSFLKFVMRELAGALGFSLNPIILILIGLVSFTFIKFKESRCTKKS